MPWDFQAGGCGGRIIDGYAYSVCYCDIDLGSDEYAYSVLVMFSLLLTPLCCDDMHDVTPRVSALVRCDRLVSEPLVMSPPTRKKFCWGTVFPTRLKRYKDPEMGLRIKQKNRKCRIPINLCPCRVEEKLIMRKLEGKWIMKQEMRMISKDGTISEFFGYTSSKEEEEE
uniref:Uncharacterized protein n=1 Tax=Tanacetum cinerariifolium TaxID=118510 RepID=A0A699HEX9_TANCI|nr:hypothetical protein [Tanacetum cinerariifolium]